MLALDTSAGACSVALWQNGATLAQESTPLVHGHAEALAPMVERVMRAAGVPFETIAAVAVTVGPGSFTGLRVGLAFARGLGLAVGCPVLGATTTAVLARMAESTPARPGRSPETPTAVVLDARRAEVFLHILSVHDNQGQDGPVSGPVSLPPEAVAAHLPPGPGRLTGDGVALLPQPLPAGWIVAENAGRTPDPAVLAAQVAAAPKQALPPRPLYVRAPDATLPPPNARAQA
ncbi:tRNA (adenosine(37)-N6)-threonylcarbamoyltransferase complex dimerization subunit type 1 TsaB [Roseospira marina]|uniref:tRNA (Adenosine(37)-N6)-threonylcarbamoyltransferase complex dimerization subunit type 1 TsaB n=1 Tax=Roseospira marina TaxID=140057 RepID=A0A5M6ICP0_9PROT|nr:tRNA (adenosine(37)-N6)-threonylcarbamoyltransferase complex dimerization subunit type 1 TsaB [Roseospira marina]